MSCKYKFGIKCQFYQRNLTSHGDLFVEPFDMIGPNHNGSTRQIIPLDRQQQNIRQVKTGLFLQIMSCSGKEGGLMHLQKASTQVSQRSPRWLTWAETFCC